ncbi:ATP-binding protein [Haloarcula japonica]|uniref:histidine kinase n=1 Tax=Haloarcula japonica (strain ATCC 49778 / DSM 6131 / JCM 7785 / NBRC 101032 / NCIMB 13157 / TR-1) TaxID=1227453 RepID=M0LJQ2_HALJT|nr:ATP-binding protein [Haloarcula japonica]EMA32649.1 membrane bound his kinase A [Haloarcula japonica DSM 6131]
MTSPALTKQSLGTGYVVATGVVISGALLAHGMSLVRPSPIDVVILSVGLTPALALVAANYWLPVSGLSGDQIWTAAEWCGLGIALFTLIKIVVLLAPVPQSSMVPSILASGVAVGGFGGILFGWLLELRRSRRRLAQSNEVLFRVLRHDLRNDLNVALGHLGELQRETAERGDPKSRAHVEQLNDTIDDIIDTTEKARQIEFAFDADRRAQEPIDLVPCVREQAKTIRQSYPEVTVELDLPAESRVYADWMLDTVLQNVIENAVIHCEETPTLFITVEEQDRTVFVHVSDNCPSIPQHEQDVLDSGTETQLSHSKGIGLWLTTWIVESYGGAVHLTATDDGNTVTLEFRGPTVLDDIRQTLREWP